MRRFLVTGLAVVVLAGAVGLWLSRPDSVTAAELPTHQADVARGALVFHATGCASCHAAPDAQGEAKLVLAGGHAFATEFGTFYAPNISPDTDEGIGGWTDADFISPCSALSGPAQGFAFIASCSLAFAATEGEERFADAKKTVISVFSDERGERRREPLSMVSASPSASVRSRACTGFASLPCHGGGSFSMHHLSSVIPAATASRDPVL